MKYVPHDYQTYATDFILAHPEDAVLLDMGLGKSVITLSAIQELCLDAPCWRGQAGRFVGSADSGLCYGAFLCRH